MKKFEGKVGNHIVRSIVKIDNNTGKIEAVSQTFRFGCEATETWDNLVRELEGNSLLDITGDCKESQFTYEEENGNIVYLPFTVKSKMLGVNITFQMLESEMILPMDLYFD